MACTEKTACVPDRQRNSAVGQSWFHFAGLLVVQRHIYGNSPLFVNRGSGPNWAELLQYEACWHLPVENPFTDGKGFCADCDCRWFSKAYPLPYHGNTSFLNPSDIRKSFKNSSLIQSRVSVSAKGLIPMKPFLMDKPFVSNMKTEDNSRKREQSGDRLLGTEKVR